MQKNNQTFIFFLGIDLGKVELFVALRKDHKLIAQAKFDNTSTGLSALLQWLKKFQATPDNTLICVEFTGVYGERLSMVAHGANYKLWKVPGQRMAHIQLKVDREKSDPADARKIAAFCERFSDQARFDSPEKPEIRQLRHLTRFRRQLVNQRQRLLNQLSAYQQEPIQLDHINRSQMQILNMLAEEIKAVEKQMRQLIEQNKQLRKIFDTLCSIPGIGPVTARKLIITTQAFTKLNCHKKLAAFAGTAPFENSSGITATWKKKSISQKADKKLKALLTTAVMSVIKPGAYFEEYYKVLLQKPGRLKMQAINMIRNKLLKIVVTLVKKDQLFDKDLFKNNCKSWIQDLEIS